VEVSPRPDTILDWLQERGSRWRAAVFVIILELKSGKPLAVTEAVFQDQRLVPVADQTGVASSPKFSVHFNAAKMRPSLLKAGMLGRL